MRMHNFSYVSIAVSLQMKTGVTMLLTGPCMRKLTIPTIARTTELKGSTYPSIRAALDELKNQGKRPSEFEDDLSPLVEKIIQMQPDIKNG